VRRQVPTLGIVMIVLGIINTLFYIAYLVLSVLGMTGSLLQDSGYSSDAEQFGQLMGSGLGFAWMAIWILGGVLWAVAGARIRGFHGRIFAIVVIIIGVVPCCFSSPCCTWVLNLGVGIWGLIVLFSGDTAGAFQEVADGAFPDEVLQ